jgi:hypothetical protein
MTWTRPDPFGAAMGTVGAFVSAAAQAKKDKADADRQAAQDRAAASTAAVDNAYKTAQTGKIGIDEKRDAAADVAKAAQQQLENTDAGYGVIPPEAPVQQPGGPPVSARQWSDYYAKYAVSLAKAKSLKGAKTASDLATSWGTQAGKEEASALALRKEANTEIETQARMHHWTADEKQKAKDAADRLIIASNHDATSVQNTQAHIAAIISSATIAANSRLKVEREGQAGALQRERETTKGANQRAAGVQTGATTRANITHGTKVAKPRSLTTEQEAAIKLKATSLVQGGTMTKEQVRAALVDEYNLAPDQADAIVAEPDDE